MAVEDFASGERMLSRREPEPAIDSTVMASYRHHPVNLYLAGGHQIAGGVVRHVGARTVECLTNHGAVTVSLYAIEAVESLVPQSAVVEFPHPDNDRTGSAG